MGSGLCHVGTLVGWSQVEGKSHSTAHTHEPLPCPVVLCQANIRLITVSQPVFMKGLLTSFLTIEITQRPPPVYYIEAPRIQLLLILLPTLKSMATRSVINYRQCVCLCPLFQEVQMATCQLVVVDGSGLCHVDCLVEWSQVEGQSHSTACTCESLACPVFLCQANIQLIMVSQPVYTKGPPTSFLTVRYYC